MRNTCESRNIQRVRRTIRRRLGAHRAITIHEEGECPGPAWTAC